MSSASPLVLRWTAHAVDQLASLAEYIGLSSPIYAEQVVDRIVRRLDQACRFPDSGRAVPEFVRADVRELLEPPYRLVYRRTAERIEVLSVLHMRRELDASTIGDRDRIR